MNLTVQRIVSMLNDWSRRDILRLFAGVNLSPGTLPFLTRNDGTGTEGQIKASTFPDEVHNILDFGAAGDGTTDDTAAFQTAAGVIGAHGGVLFIPRRGACYLVRNPINLTGVHGVSLVSNGAELRVAAGTPDVSNPAWPTYAHDSVIRLIGCHDVVISGLTINGNLSNRVAHAGGEAFNSLIHLGGCSRVSITGCVLTEGMTDGIFVGMDQRHTPSTSVTIRDCTISACRRNNISAVGVKGLLIEACDLSLAGTVQGTNPKAAIDVEPEVAGTSETIHILHNRVHGNAGVFAVYLTGTVGTLDARVEGNVIEDNLGSGIYINAHNNGVYVSGNTIRRHMAMNCSGLYVLGSGVYAVSHNTFEANQCGLQCDGNPDLYVAGNRFVANTQYGLVATHAAGVVKRLRVEGNHFLDNTSVAGVANGAGYAFYAFTDPNSIILFANNVVESSVGANPLQLGVHVTSACHDLYVGNLAKNLSNNLTWLPSVTNRYANLSADAPP